MNQIVTLQLKQNNRALCREDSMELALTIPCWIIIIVGVVANLLGLIVLLQPALRRQSTFVYLIFLSVTDTMTLILHGITNIHSHYTYTYHTRVAYMLPFQTLQQASSWILVAVTVERYIIVKHPLRARTMCTRKITFIVISAVLIVSPVSQGFGLTCFIHFQQCSLAYEFIFVGIYAFVPFLIFIVANIIIISHMKQRSNMQSDLTNVTLGHGQETIMNREERRVTVMLAATTVTFF